MLKNKLMIGISFITILLLIYISNTDNISDLKFSQNAMNKIYGYQEPEGGATYIEALGLEYITLGSIFTYGVNDETIYYYMEKLLNSSLVEDGKLIEEDILDKINQNTAEDENYLHLESICKITEKDVKDNQGNVLENDRIINITTPSGFNKDNLETTSNVWSYDYRFYKEGLVGVERAIWYSQLFDEELVFNRAYSSLKWLCSDRIQCEILYDEDDEFAVFVYGTDDYNWLVTFNKCYGDAFEFDKNINYINMRTIPLDPESSTNILAEFGLIKQME